MKPKIVIALLCIAVTLIWMERAGAQAAPATPKLQLPTGETVWDLSGDWDAFIENYGPWAHTGIHSNVYRITQNGNTFTSIRVKSLPYPSYARAGSRSLRGELDKDGCKEVWLIDASGDDWPSKGQISADGKKIVIEMERARVTLTRSGDRTPLVGLWRLLSFEREYQGTGDRESPMGVTPAGYILFLPEGRMTVVITGEGRKAATTTRIAWGCLTRWSRTPARTVWMATRGSPRSMCLRTRPGWARNKRGRFRSASVTASRKRHPGCPAPTTAWREP